MDYNKMLSNKKYFEKKILENKIKLEQITTSNKEFETLSADKVAGDEIAGALDTYMLNLKDLLDNVNREDKDYRNRRIEFLNSEITKMLEKFFPNKNLAANIIFDDKYKNSNAYLTLVGPDGEVRNPANTQGMLEQYLISFTAVTTVLETMDKHIMFIDEAFGVSSKTNLPKIADILEKSCKSGMQIILATQDPLLFETIPHHVINLSLNPVTDSVEIASIDDA